MKFRYSRLAGRIFPWRVAVMASGLWVTLAWPVAGQEQAPRPLRPRVIVDQPSSQPVAPPQPLPQRPAVPQQPAPPQQAKIALPLAPRWWREGETAKVTSAVADEAATLGQGRTLARGALTELREVMPKLGDAVQSDLVGKGKTVPGWAKPKAGSDEEKALAQPLTRADLQALARPFFDRLHEAAPGWVERWLRENFPTAAQGSWYPWAAAEGDGDVATPVKLAELKAAFALDFVADNERGTAADGIPDLWEEAVVHADTTGRLKDIGQITLLNAAKIGTASPAGPPPKTFALHAAGQVDRRIAGKKAADSLALFLDYQANGKSGVFKRNPKFWAADLGQELTCMSPWNAMDGSRRAGVLITPRHVLVAHHFLLNPGTVITFVSAGNEVVTRTVLTSVQVPKTDLEVVALNADLPPEITPCRVAPEDFDAYLPGAVLNRQAVAAGPFIPALGLNQEEEGFVNQLSCVSDGAVSFALPAAATESQRAEFRKSLIMYDSGNPDFFIVNSKLMLTTLWMGGGGGSGMAVWKNLAGINAAINAVDAAAKIKATGYRVKEMDLSGFLKF